MNRQKIVLFLVAAMLCIAAAPALANSDAPFGIQVVRQEAILHDLEGQHLGQAEFWNTRNNFMVELQVDGDWLISQTQVYAGTETPPLKKEKPNPGKFPCTRDFSVHRNSTMIQCSLKDELDINWGRTQDRFVAIHVDLIKVKHNGRIIDQSDAWVVPIPMTDEHGDVINQELVASFVPWPENYNNHGGYFTTKFVHPRRGHFIDSPVAGLYYQTPTHWGITDASGAFDYFPGETVQLWISPINAGMGDFDSTYPVYLGESGTDTKISPLDIFMADIEDPRVVNMARLIQSLDADGEPKGGIEIRPVVAGCLSMAMETLGTLYTGGRLRE